MSLRFYVVENFQPTCKIENQTTSRTSVIISWDGRRVKKIILLVLQFNTQFNVLIKYMNTRISVYYRFNHTI